MDKANLAAGGEPLFKQDFVVGLPNGTFVSYTAKHVAAKAASPYVKPIGNFETTYRDGGQFYMRPGPKPLVYHFPAPRPGRASQAAECFEPWADD